MTTPPLTEERLAEIEARESAAAKGPWEEIGPGRSGDDGMTVLLGAPDENGDRWHIATIDEPGDSAFIAHARQDVPDLLAEVRRLKAEVERLRLGSEQSARSDYGFAGPLPWRERP